VQPPETTQLTFQVLAEHDRLLEQLVEESSIANDKGELLRLIIADHTDTTGSSFWLSHPSLNEAERAQVALEEQKELLDKTSDELASDGEVSVETVMERFDEIYCKQKEIVELLRYFENNII
jgi:hypothetical protein